MTASTPLCRVLTTAAPGRTPLRRAVTTAAPDKPRVVILGCGWGGNAVARGLDKSRFDVRVVSPSNHFLFTPLLPSTAVGTLEFRAIQEPIRTIAGLAEYYQAKARRVDLNARKVQIEDIWEKGLFEVPFDYLIVATGAKTNTFNTPGVPEREGKDVFFLKHLYHARQIRNKILQCFEQAALPGTSEEEMRRRLTFVVVGGGPTSCEFVTELHDFITADVSRWYPNEVDKVKVVLVEAGPRIMGSFEQTLVEYVMRQLRRRKIEIRLDTPLTSVGDDLWAEDGLPVATFGDGEKLPFGMMVWSAGLSQVKLIEGLDLPKHPSGRLVVDGYLRTPGNKGRVFALGDAAADKDEPLFPLAQVAEQQGHYLARVFNGSYAQFDPATPDELPFPAPVAPSSFPPFPTFLFSKSATFSFVAKGSMSSVGSFKGVVDMSKVDLGRGPTQGPKLSGFAAFLAWRGYYFSKQFSLANMILVPMFWFKTAMFGRDISRF